MLVSIISNLLNTIKSSDFALFHLFFAWATVDNKHCEDVTFLTIAGPNKAFSNEFLDNFTIGAWKVHNCDRNITNVNSGCFCAINDKIFPRLLIVWDTWAIWWTLSALDGFRWFSSKLFLKNPISFSKSMFNLDLFKSNNSPLERCHASAVPTRS